MQLHRLAVLANALQRPVPLQPCIADVRISWCAQCVCTQAGQCVPFCPSQLFKSMQKTERKAATLQELQCMQHRNAALQDELNEAKLQQQKADAGLQAALEELQEARGLICALLLANLPANVMHIARMQAPYCMLAVCQAAHWQRCSGWSATCSPFALLFACLHLLRDIAGELEAELNKRLTEAAQAAAAGNNGELRFKQGGAYGTALKLSYLSMIVHGRVSTEQCTVLARDIRLTGMHHALTCCTIESALLTWTELLERLAVHANPSSALVAWCAASL